MSKELYGQGRAAGGRSHWLVKITSPVHFLVAMAVGAWLQRRLALPLPSTPVLTVLQNAGGVIAGVGLALAVSCFVLFARSRTTIMPSGQPAKLVLAGPYRFTRNPMYLALVLSYVGLCLQMGLPWSLLLLPLPWLALQHRVIPFEERRLHREFGNAYAAYCRRVRRWL